MKNLIVLLSLMASPALAQQLPLAGCDVNDFVTVGGSAIIKTEGRSYVPRCLKIKKGTTVTIEASSHHPLQGILNSVGMQNPIYDDLGGAVSNANVTFNETGVFGFYCLAHSDDKGTGMGGAILVEP